MLQDFNTVGEYNFALFKISSRLKLCAKKITEENMLEKKRSLRFIPRMLQQEYRERKFTKYSELISCLLVTKQNNELLMKNHKSRPTRSESFPKVNAISSHSHGSGRGHSRGRNSQYHAYEQILRIHNK